MVGIGISEIELRAVAGRQADSLASVGKARSELGRAVGIEGDPLPHLDRREPVRRADENEAHARCPVCKLTCSAINSAKPTSAAYAARRPRQPIPNRRIRNPPYTVHVSTVSAIRGSKSEPFRTRAKPAAMPSVRTGSEKATVR